MTEPQACEAITKAFVTWAAAQSSPGLSYAVENELGALPTIPPATSSRFALLTITPTTSDQLTSGEVGARFVGRNGWIQIKLWVPSGERTAGIGALESSARTAMEMQNIIGPVATDETIDTRAGYVQTVGNDGRWYMQVLRIPYTFFETK